MWPPGLETKMGESEELSVQRRVSAFKDRVVHAEQADQGWWELCGVPDVGAILVRPDEHVAWRSLNLPDRSSAEHLHRAFAEVFPALASPTSTQQCA